GATWGLDNVQVRVDAATTQAADVARLPQPTDLGPGWEIVELVGTGINDAGVVVGRHTIVLAPPEQGMGIAPLIWQNGQIGRVPAQVFSQSDAVDINNAGHVAGNDEEVLGSGDLDGWLINAGTTTFIRDRFDR